MIYSDMGKDATLLLTTYSGFTMDERTFDAAGVDKHLSSSNAYSVSLLSHWSTLPHQDTMPAVASWDISTPAGKTLLAQRLTQPSETLWDWCETEAHEIEIDEISAHYGEYESEERPGELIQGPILTLYGPSGAYHTGSEPSFRALQRIAGIIGAPPWSPSIRVKVYRRVSRHRNIYLHLEYIGRSAV